MDSRQSHDVVGHSADAVQTDMPGADGFQITISIPLISHFYCTAWASSGVPLLSSTATNAWLHTHSYTYQSYILTHPKEVGMQFPETQHANYD